MELLGRETEPAGVDRTVDDARIQAKLGVRSRVELAGRLAR